MTRPTEVIEYMPEGITVEKISRGTHQEIGAIGLDILDGDSLHLFQNGELPKHLSSDQKHAALFVRAQGLIQQNPLRKQ